MSDFILLLRRFIPPYKKYLGLSIATNALSAVLNLLSFLLIIPILEMLFGINTVVYERLPVVLDPLSRESWSELVGACVNNFYYFISRVIETHGATQALLVLGVFLVGTTVLRIAAMYFSMYFMIPIRTGVVRDIRNQINAKILALPLAFFSEERKGDILARMSGDVNEIETSIMSSLDMLFKNPILIVIYLVGMFVVSWQLTLFVLVLLPLAGYLMGWVGKSLRRTSALGQQQWGGLMSQVEETLGGLRIVQAFGAEGAMRERFRTGNEAFRRTTNRIFRRQQLAHPMSELLGTVAITIVLYYGGYLILSGQTGIRGASFIYYLTIFYWLITPAKELSRSFYAIQKGMASMDRVDRILTAESNIVDPVAPLPVVFDQGIAFRNVRFRYGERWIIREVSLDIRKGETVALVGQSGSGKSTLVDLLPRFYDVQEGSIRIDGVDIRSVGIRELRRLMGIVNQEAILFNDTFFNNIAFGADRSTLTREEVMEAARIANAYEFIMATEAGFETTVGDRGGKLSGGQRQRISIARAVLKNPPILILDEATSALDTESERLVQDALERLMKNRTTIVVAHRLSTVKNADQICVLHEGRIVEQGTHEDLLARNGYYTRLCDMQAF
jgi:ATP-binding cassette subfamily B protein/subfamily B ATP-binding cassette protein MsbA